MIVCDICGKKFENEDTENYIALGEDVFYADVYSICSNCLTSIRNFIENKRGEKQ